MDSTSLLSGLVSQLGSISGLPGLDLDEHKHAAIVFNKTITIHFQVSGESILFYTQLGTLPDDHPLDGTRRLLRANFLWLETLGATFSLSPDGTIMLSQSVAPDGLDLPTFQERLFIFARTATRWRESLLQVPYSNTPDFEPSGRNGDMRDMPDFAIQV